MAPLGILGIASRTLFGTATLSDVEEMTSKINNIDVEKSKIVQINNKQIHVITKAFDQYENLTKRHRQEMDKFQQLFDNISRKMNESMVDDKHRETNGAGLPIPKEHLRAEEISKIANIDAVHHQDKLILIIGIPLIRKEPFQLYKRNALPVQQLHEKQHMGWAHIQPTHQYICLSTDSRHYLKIDQDDLNKCLTTRTGIVCDYSNPIQVRTPNQGCEATLLAESSPTILKSCDIRFTKVRENFWKYLEKENVWLFSMERAETMLIDCLNSRQTSSRLEGTGTIRLTDGCVGLTPTITLGGKRSPENYVTQAKYPKINLNIFNVLPKLILVRNSNELSFKYEAENYLLVSRRRWKKQKKTRKRIIIRVTLRMAAMHHK